MSGSLPILLLGRRESRDGVRMCDGVALAQENGLHFASFLHPA